jgi:hypothetical protein
MPLPGPWVKSVVDGPAPEYYSCHPINFRHLDGKEGELICQKYKYVRENQ